MKLLLTAFDPFDHDKLNASEECLKLLKVDNFAADVKKIVLPTSFTRALPMLYQQIDKFQPDVVLSLGQASGRSALTIERVAINIMDSDKADNDGYIPQDETIIENTVDAYFSTLPIKLIRDSILSVNVPARISNSAGSFVCNQIMFGALDYIAKHYPNSRAGFIHIPSLPSQVLYNDLASMSAYDSARGLEAAIETICQMDI